MMLLRLSIIASIFCLLAAKKTKHSRWNIDSEFKSKIDTLTLKKKETFHRAIMLADGLHQKIFPSINETLNHIESSLIASLQGSSELGKWKDPIKTMVSRLSKSSWYQNPEMFEWDIVTPFSLPDSLKLVEQTMFNNHISQAMKCMKREDDECTKRCLNIAELTINFMGKMLQRYALENYQSFIALVKSKHDRVKLQIIAHFKTAMTASNPSNFNPDLNEILKSLDVVPSTKLTESHLTAKQNHDLRIINIKLNDIKFEAFKLSENVRKTFMSAVNETMSTYQKDLRKMFEVSQSSQNYVGIDVDESIDTACRKLEGKQVGGCIKSIENQLYAYAEIKSSIEMNVVPLLNTLQNVTLTAVQFDQKYQTAMDEINKLNSKLGEWFHRKTVNQNLDIAKDCCKKEVSMATEEMRLSLQDDETYYPHEEF